MPDFGSATFSQNDASNNSGTMPSWSGSAAPSTLDDAGRALQGAATREWNWRSFTLTAAGTADAKTLTFSVAPAAYYNGQRFAFIANTTNTASATLNVNSLGAKTIKKDVSGTLTNLSASEMVSGMFVEVAYNTSGDCFVWVNRGALPQALGTGDSPQFSGVNVGDASDTTITRSAAGVLAVEGGVIPKENRSNWFINPQSFTATGAGSSGAIALRQNSGDTAGAFIQWTNNNATVQQGTIVVDTAAVMLFSAAGGINLNGRLLIDTSGNVLNMSSGGLGYGTGSGGTVTQLTNKSTGVTLNKTNGQIVTHNANLGTANPVGFVVTNSTVAATDTVIVHRSSGGTNAAYVVGCDAVSAGSFRVYISNVSGGALAEALTLNFAVIKAVTS